MTVQTIKMTAAQFTELGDSPPGVRLELVDGEIIVSPSPRPRHSYTAIALSVVLYSHIRARRLGRLYSDVDTIFGPHDVRRPDLAFFAKNRLHLVGESAMQGSPDLCIEILSPSSIRTDRKDKFKQYEKAKVPHYWIVDPLARSLEAYKLIRGKYRPSGKGSASDKLQLPPFDDLTIPLAELWQPK